jgi:hypothetical protein
MRPGGLVEGNLMLRNPLGILVGTSQYAPTVFNTIRNNVVLDAKDINSSELRGTGIELGDVSRALVEGNIIAHQVNGTGNILGLSFTRSRNLTIRGNIVYQWNRPGFGWGVALSWTDGSGSSSISGNKLQQVLGGLAVSHEPNSPYSSGFAYSGNEYFSINPIDGYPWFANAGGYMSIADWGQLTGETGATYTQFPFPDAGRTIEQYAGAIGLGVATLDAFLAEARRQSRQHWRPALTAATVGAWVRAGFGVGCRGDYNGDGAINILDFNAFNNDFQARNPQADFNQDGSYNIMDFVAFINAAAAGC